MSPCNFHIPYPLVISGRHFLCLSYSLTDMGVCWASVVRYSIHGRQMTEYGNRPHLRLNVTDLSLWVSVKAHFLQLS